MPDLFSATATATTELPREPRLGLRRRHQSGLVFQDNNAEDSEISNPTRREGTGGIIENQDRNAPQNIEQGTRNNNDNEEEEDTDMNNRRATATRQPSTASSFLSPLSGSIGIGMFRITRFYCFISILSAMVVIVLSPVPTHKIQLHHVASIIYEAAEGDDNVPTSASQNSPLKATTTRIGGRRYVKKNTNNNIVENVNSIVTDHLKSWSVEDFITRAAFLGATASQNHDIESRFAAIRNHTSDKKGTKANKHRKRRRRAPASDEHRTECRTKTDDFTKKEKTPVVKKRFLASALSKARKSPGITNINDNNGKVSATRSRNWIDRTSSLWAESMAEIVKRRKAETKTPVEPRVSWRGLHRNEDITGDAVQESSDSKGYDNIDTMEHARDTINEDWQWIDPIFLEHGSFSLIFTNIIDKILKSTIRLCIITNFLLTTTHLLHSAVASWFLSHSGAYGNTAAIQRQSEANMREDRTRVGTEWSFTSPSGANVARERMGGFLIFKLLLISAVLTPDALDLMILVTWFTLLGCLRSLDHLAHSTNIHLAAVGQHPRKGIVQLLVWVLSCDILAAGSCVALFHTAGYGMVLLLTCDCALLGTDAISHILKYYQCVWENSHDNDIRCFEERQLNLHRVIEQNSDFDSIQADEGRDESYPSSVFMGRQDDSLPTAAAMTRVELRQELGRLDHQMEDLELGHTRRLSILDTAIFCLDMTCHIFTVAHFCHIWALHGVQFTLIDGVLALHLHSAISTACAKLTRRRNVHRIAQDLEGHFPDATDEELKQVSIDGDVCCICLGSMSKGSKVKKAQCGHMYHTHCLREVIERAQSLESAKCPLCRAPLVSKCRSTSDPSLNNGNFIRQSNTPVDPRIPGVQTEINTVDSQIEGNSSNDTVPVHQVEEQALFRFSTEGILPAWLPVPAFSFEVIRRPSVGAQRVAHMQNQELQTATQGVNPVDRDSSNQGEVNPELQTEFEIQAQQSHEGEQHAQISFFQRVLLFTGLMPISPEEEARALSQLVDMFPQYHRSDLLRELRNRGSLEAVTEAILIGTVPGVPRGE